MKNMDISESQLIRQLQELKENGAVGAKGEFEAEGLTYEQMSFFSVLCEKVKLPLTIKIGGCEAKTDLNMAVQLGASSYVAPMIESVFALNKFKSLRNSILVDPNSSNCFINIESVQGVKNLDLILQSEAVGIDGVIFGRGDFLASLDDASLDVESEPIYRKIELVSKKCQFLNLKFGLGGGLSENSLGQLKRISYLNFFETRKIIFDKKALYTDENEFHRLIQKALIFEINWLKFKTKNFQGVNEDKRIEKLTERIGRT